MVTQFLPHRNKLIDDEKSVPKTLEDNVLWSSYASRNGIGYVKFLNEFTPSNNTLLSSDNIGDHTKIYALEDCTVVAQFGGQPNVSGYPSDMRLDIYDINNAVKKISQQYEPATNGSTQVVTVTHKILQGEYVTARSVNSALSASDTGNHMTITAYKMIHVKFKDL